MACGLSAAAFQRESRAGCAAVVALCLENRTMDADVVEELLTEELAARLPGLGVVFARAMAREYFLPWVLIELRTAALPGGPAAS